MSTQSSNSRLLSDAFPSALRASCGAAKPERSASQEKRWTASDWRVG